MRRFSPLSYPFSRSLPPRRLLARAHARTCVVLPSRFYDGGSGGGDGGGGSARGLGSSSGDGRLEYRRAELILEFRRDISVVHPATDPNPGSVYAKRPSLFLSL